MKLVKLNDGCTVNPLEISEVTINDYGNTTVRMKSGVGHSVSKEYGDVSGYSTYDKVVASINKALECCD